MGTHRLTRRQSPGSQMRTSQRDGALSGEQVERLFGKGVQSGSWRRMEACKRRGGEREGPP